jgi:hypothetical protein
MMCWAAAADVGAWSGVGVVKGDELTNVVRSTIENVSSPTLLMSDVMRSVSDVLGRVVVGVAALAVPAIADTPKILVASKAVIARTESFLGFIIFVFIILALVLKYIECYRPQYFLDSTISRFDIIEARIIRPFVS